MEREPTILLCVGATKAGTTWLYNQLRIHPDAHVRAIKELHFFDTVESGGWNWQIKVHRRKLADMAARVARGDARPGVSRRRQGDVHDWLAVLSGRTADVTAYLAYLQEGRGERPVVADITPSYALLNEARLRQMADMAGDVRFVYIMRDPVARFWSNIRMLAARAGITEAGFEAAARDLLDRVLDGEPSGAVERSDYAGAVLRLRAAVVPERLHLAFHETVLTPAGMENLCNFLGIRPFAAGYDRIVFQGTEARMTAEQVRRARAFLAPQYDFVAQEFPGEMPAAWARNMVKEAA